MAQGVVTMTRNSGLIFIAVNLFLLWALHDPERG
jgi:hypothetical protein